MFPQLGFFSCCFVSRELCLQAHSNYAYYTVYAMFVLYYVFFFFFLLSGSVGSVQTWCMIPGENGQEFSSCGTLRDIKRYI